MSTNQKEGLSEEIKTPKELVEYYYRAPFSKGARRFLTVQFLHQHPEFSSEDVRVERLHHPTVIAKKNKNVSERIRKRMEEANRHATQKGKRLSQDELRFFLDNELDKPTLELAIAMKRPLPTIYYLKRVWRNSNHNRELFLSLFPSNY